MSRTGTPDLTDLAPPYDDIAVLRGSVALFRSANHRSTSCSPGNSDAGSVCLQPAPSQRD